MTGRRLFVVLLSLGVIAGLAARLQPARVSTADAEATTATTTTTLAPDADARVRENAPERNFGDSARLRTRGGPDTHVDSYLKFTIPDSPDVIQSVKLRVFAVTGTDNGPALWTSGTEWGEGDITWRNRPDRTSDVTDDKGSIAADTWVEFDVTDLVSGPGTYSFGLGTGAADDAVDFFSREAPTENTPQLVVTSAPPPPAAPQCSDGVDNDSDGQIDFPADPGCSGADDDSESPDPVPGPPAAAQCSDGVDNDSDGKVDFPSDPGCSSADDDSESPDPTGSGSGSEKVVLAAGDIQPASQSSDAAATAALVESTPHDAVLALGDNQYENGTLAEYTTFWAHTWGAFNGDLYPTPGNHEHHTAVASNYCAYFDGKTPLDVCANSTSDPYYKVTIGDWDVFAVDTGATGDVPQATKTWLSEQLAASTAQCQLVFWHHPRYSAGSHGSTASQADDWAMLMQHHVELVLSGHDHNLQVWDRMGANGTPDPSNGIRQFVSGTGGKSHYGTGNRPTGLQFINTTTFGILKLTLRQSDYDWAFIPVGGGAPLTTGTDTCH